MVVSEVRITKDGLLVLEWDGKARQHVPRTPAAALNLLRWPCRVEAGVTLGDIFQAVQRDQKLKRFLEVWSCCDITAYHREARQGPGKPSNLVYVELAKRLEWSERKAQQTICVSCIGEDNRRGMTRYGLDFIPVNELVRLPVRLREQIEIWRGHRKLGEAPCKFTLLEVLGEIYWEIGFYGSPESRDQEAAMLRRLSRGTNRRRVPAAPLQRT